MCMCVCVWGGGGGGGEGGIMDKISTGFESWPDRIINLSYIKKLIPETGR